MNRPAKFSRLIRLVASAAALTLIVPEFVWATEAGTVKIATVAPKGSIYHRVLQEIGEAYRSASGPQARYIVYPESIQGSEADVVRRMRVGQIDASLITIVGLHDIDPSVGILQYMPMMFRSWEEVDYVREHLRANLEAKLAAKGFVVLFWGEAGWVQFFTKNRISLPEEYQHGKIFTWAGDAMQMSLMKSLNFTPVAMQITDILPALETGMIDVVPVAPIWSLVGQFDRVTHYMLPVKWAPIVGAAVMRKQTFDAMTPAARQAVLTASRTAGEKLRANRTVQDADSIRALQARGMTVLPLTAEVERAWQSVAARAWQLERGTMVPGELLDEVQSLLNTYRQGNKP